MPYGFEKRNKKELQQLRKMYEDKIPRLRFRQMEIFAGRFPILDSSDLPFLRDKIARLEKKLQATKMELKKRGG